MIYLVFLIAAISELWTLILKRDTANTFMKWILGLWILAVILFGSNALRNAIDERIETNTVRIETND
jgi:hypothetical protein